MLRALKRALKPLAFTPLHPQWLCFLKRDLLDHAIRQTQPTSCVLDIGCGDMWARNLLPNTCEYIGLDYPTTTAEVWQGLPRSVFSTAEALPIKTEVIDTVLLLNVLEHVLNAEAALSEIARVLKPNGTLILEVPYLYPLHDEPWDFRRLTRHGLMQLLTNNHLTLTVFQASGKPIETSCLLMNIAISKACLNWISRKNPLGLLAIFAPFALLSINMLGWLASKLEAPDTFMPFSYLIVAEKNTKVP